MKAYLEASDETRSTARNLSAILRNEFSSYSRSFHMLDVGCSDGDLTFSLVPGLLEMFPDFSLLGLEPEIIAHGKFMGRKVRGGSIEAENLRIQEFLDRAEARESFDYIQFVQCWYHFPRDDWGFVFDGSYSLLKRNGVMIITLDSHSSEIYKLKDLIMEGRSDTLEYGDAFCAEDVERFLCERDIIHRTVQFPVYIHVKDDGQKLQKFARTLAFLCRTYPEKILSGYESEISDLLERNKRGNGYRVENLVKSLIVRKDESL